MLMTDCELAFGASDVSLFRDAFFLVDIHMYVVFLVHSCLCTHLSVFIPTFA